MIKSELPRHIRWINAFILLIMGALTIWAVAPWNAWNVSPESHSYGWNRFSFFTVQSNFIATAAYITAASAILGNRKLGGWFRYLRGAAVLYMLVTGIIYALLLSDTAVNPNPGQFDWSNFILHQFGPFFITVWWLLWPSRLPISSYGSLVWLIFPVLWLIYTFVRASITSWYPYPFLDPEQVGGTLEVTMYVLGITLVFMILSLLLAWISRARANNRTLY
jgi:hypothetical protein